MVVPEAVRYFWGGYDRIVGALANLGYEISDQTVGNVLRRHALPPGGAAGYGDLSTVGIIGQGEVRGASFWEGDEREPVSSRGCSAGAISQR